MKKQNFAAKCLSCEADTCKVHVILRYGEEDLGICKGCPCSKEPCVWCDRTGEHWLGCPTVGIPVGNAPPKESLS